MDAKDIPAGPARDAALWLEQHFPDRYGSPEVRRLLWFQRQLRKLRKQCRRQEALARATETALPLAGKRKRGRQ
jgi:hypothetical protein